MKEPTVRVTTLLEILKMARSAPLSAKEAADALGSRDVKIKPLLNEMEAQGLLMSRQRVRPAVDEFGGLHKGMMPTEYMLSPVWGGQP